MDPARFVVPGKPGPSAPQAQSQSQAQPPQARPPATKKRARQASDAGPSTASGTAGDLSKVRAFAACRACRQKKVKCLPGPATGAGGAAACQQCTMSGAECEYQPTRDRAAYSRAYVQDLSGRVQALESLQSRLMPLLAAFEGGKVPPGLSGARAAASTDVTDSEDERVVRSRRHSPVGDNDEESRRFLTDERGNYRWIGASNTLSLMDSFAGDPRELPSRVAYNIVHDDGIPDEESPPDSHPYFAPVSGAGVVRAIPGVDSVTFPPRADAERMLNAYFEEVHPVLPILLEPDFRDRFHALMDKVERGDFSNIRAGFICVVFAIFALGERVIVAGAAWQRERAKAESHDPAVKQEEHILPGEAEAGVIWFERAQVLHFSSISEIDLLQVQSLTLLSAFQASVNAMPSSWLLASQALRIAQDIGLHRYAPHFKVSLKVKQLGARAWWAIYGLERLVSITLGRPLCVDDADIDLEYPLEVDDASICSVGTALTEEAGSLPPEAADSTIGGFVALTKLCKIAGRVAQLLYRPTHGRSVNDASWSEQQQRTIDKLDKLLRDWLQNEVPQKYKDASNSRPISLMSAVLSNSYFAVLITLHRNLLPSNPDFPRPKPIPSSQSLAHCVDAARSVLYIAAQSKVLVPVSHHLAVFCQYLWSSAVILLLVETRAREQMVVDAVGGHVESCQAALLALEPVWPGAHKLRELLCEVESRAKQVRAATTRPSTANAKKRKSPSADRNGRGRNSASSASGVTAANNSSPVRDGAIQGKWPGAGSNPPSGSATQYPTPPIPGSLGVAPSSLGGVPSYDLFDVSGMNFDGLEMLNAFTSDAWQAPLPSASPMDVTKLPQQSPGANGPPNNRMLSSSSSTGDPTPTLGAQPSPVGGSVQSVNSASGSGWFTHGLGPSAPSPAPGPSELAEMWAQIAGTSFDWQADPSVPFNI